MFRKAVKLLILLSVAYFALGIIGWYAVRYISTQKASQKASNIIAKISPQSDEEQRLIALTKHVFNNFQHKDPTTISWYKVRPYITNKRLPEFIRLPAGVMETNLQQGFCDNASRMLAFVLEHEGFSSVQWNMITDRGGHSARLVTLSDGRNVFVDPFYGIISVDENGRLADLETAQNRVKAGEKLGTILMSLGEQSNDGFYRNIKNMYMAAEGNELTIVAKIPQIKGDEPIILGKVNGQGRDVKSAAINLKITPYWYYMGHKYNREWLRILEAQQPVKIIMTLVQPAEKGILTATPSPSVHGKTLTWNLKAGEQIKLQDGLAKISLKRLNSYINVDQIKIYPTQ